MRHGTALLIALGLKVAGQPPWRFSPAGARVNASRTDPEGCGKLVKLLSRCYALGSHPWRRQMSSDALTNLVSGVFDSIDREIALNFANAAGQITTLKISEAAFQQLFIRAVILGGEMERARIGAPAFFLTPEGIETGELATGMLGLGFQFPHGGMIRMALPKAAQPGLEQALERMRKLR